MGTEVINGFIITQTGSLVTVSMHYEFHCERNRQEEEETELYGNGYVT